ncbi:hypothetical protein ASD46_13810 [Rhizobium sp. Root491]|nr:hypothetical protein ASD46_13810 [Rhizobium sp. Root491]
MFFPVFRKLAGQAGSSIPVGPVIVPFKPPLIECLFGFFVKGRCEVFFRLGATEKQAVLIRLFFFFATGFLLPELTQIDDIGGHADMSP